MKKKNLAAFFVGITMVFFSWNAFAQNEFKFNVVEGETIAVFAPLVGESVPSDDREWISDVVQGKLVNAFYTYSNFIPFDQGVINIAVNQIKESQANAVYDENTMLTAGKLIMAKYFAYVEISYLEKSNEYNMNFYIVNIETNRPLATSSKTCTREQLRVKNEHNAIYASIHEMLTGKRIDSKFRKAESWNELESFLGKTKKKSNTKTSKNFKKFEDKSVAVFNPIFKNCTPTESDEFEKVLRGRLVDAFFKYSLLDAFDGTTGNKMIEAIKGSSSVIYDETTVLQAGRMANATYMCYVKIIKIGDNQYNIYYNLLHTETGVPWATFEDDCNYDEIVNKDQNSITNRAVAKMLRNDLGPSTYDEADLRSLENALADQRANSAKYKAEREKAANAEKEKTKKERQAAEKAERKAEKKAEKNSNFMANQRRNPTSGLTVGGGFNFASANDENWWAGPVATVALVFSPANFVGVGVRSDFLLQSSDNLCYDVMGQLDFHICFTRSFATYAFVDLGANIIYYPSDESSDSKFSAGTGLGLYFMFPSSGWKIFAEYGVFWTGRPDLGFCDRVSAGLTYNIN